MSWKIDIFIYNFMYDFFSNRDHFQMFWMNNTGDEEVSARKTRKIDACVLTVWLKDFAGALS